jgi:hypothetical protein
MNYLLKRYGKISISFSGGRSSAVMTKLLLDQYRDTHEICVTFANTGCEHPATLDFIDACDRHWGFNTIWVEAVVDPTPGVGVRHRIVDFDSASRKGEPFEAVIQKYGLPNSTSPMCTTRLKENVLTSYRNSIGWRRGQKLDSVTAIGIRADEIDRMRTDSEKEGFIYPLVEAGFTKSMVNSYLRPFSWDLKLPSDAYGNCSWCWKKSDRKLFTIALEDPSVFSFPARMESLYSENKPGTKACSNDGRRYLFRNHRSTLDILEQANSFQGLKYRDVVQCSIFDFDLDRSSGCSESCEVGHV